MPPPTHENTADSPAIRGVRLRSGAHRFRRKDGCEQGHSRHPGRHDCGGRASIRARPGSGGDAPGWEGGARDRRESGPGNRGAHQWNGGARLGLRRYVLHRRHARLGGGAARRHGRGARTWFRRRIASPRLRRGFRGCLRARRHLHARALFSRLVEHNQLGPYGRDRRRRMPAGSR